VIIEAEPVKGRSDEPAPTGRTSSKRSSSRQRSSAKSEPEPERIDPLAAERHSAAAAATAAIAAALHPEARHDSEPSARDVHDGLADGIDHTERAGHGVRWAESDETVARPDPSGAPTPEPEDAPAVKAPRTRKTAAKKTSATKKTAAKKAAAKKAPTKKAAKAKNDVASQPVLESVGSSS
jgi:ribonuclease E